MEQHLEQWAVEQVARSMAKHDQRVFGGQSPNSATALVNAARAAGFSVQAKPYAANLLDVYVQR